MSKASIMTTWDADTRTICEASDHEVEEWHQAARSGQSEAKKKLRCWAYATAHKYFHARVTIERSLTDHDADELTSQFFVEFEERLPNVRTATHFARRMLKNMLGRYGERERLHQRRTLSSANFDELECLILPVEWPGRPWERWSDREWYQYRATLDVLRNADETTRSIISYRLQGYVYKEIATMVDLSEAALRMRVTRFYRSVRNLYDRLERERIGAAT